MRSRRRIWPSFATSRTSPPNSFARRWPPISAPSPVESRKSTRVRSTIRRWLPRSEALGQRGAHRRRGRDVERAGEIEHLHVVDDVDVDREILVSCWLALLSRAAVDVHPSYSRHSAIWPRWSKRTVAHPARSRHGSPVAFGDGEPVHDAGAIAVRRAPRRPRSRNASPDRGETREFAPRSRRGRGSAPCALRDTRRPRRTVPRRRRASRRAKPVEHRGERRARHVTASALVRLTIAFTIAETRAAAAASPAFR